jgi:hypothetical protein
LIDITKEKMTQKEISSNLRLDGFSWCYFSTAKGRFGLYLVPTLRQDGFPVNVTVMDNNGRVVIYEHHFDVPKKEWSNFFNNIIDQLNDI